MCGRVELDLEISNPAMRRLRELLKAQFPGAKIASGEKYPSDLLPVFTAGEEKPALTLMRWGYPMKNSSRQVINARVESAEVKPLFRESLRSRRCILPTSGFFEWAHDGRNAKYLFRLPDDPMLYLACLYHQYEDGPRFVILTQTANDSVADVHQRMPVVIAQKKIPAWLNDTDSAGRIIRQSGPQLIKIAQ